MERIIIRGILNLTRDDYTRLGKILHIQILTHTTKERIVLLKGSVNFISPLTYFIFSLEKFYYLKIIWQTKALQVTQKTRSVIRK